jgi:hypothetical protein
LNRLPEAAGGLAAEIEVLCRHRLGSAKGRDDPALPDLSR